MAFRFYTILAKRHINRTQNLKGHRHGDIALFLIHKLLL